ncbi:MAG: hypothetical protein HY719_18050 [Planctomycetes bacterium]|nr:hypothetical protein [Planctomycetota bacterium]
MDQHFLDAEVKDAGLSGFKPEIWYNLHGDCLEFCAANEGVEGDRIDSVITIYRSTLDRRPIGFQVKGVRALIDLLDATSFSVEARGDQHSVFRVKVEVVTAAAFAQAAQRNPRIFRHLDRLAPLMTLMGASAQGGDEIDVPTSVGEPALS